MPVQTAESSAVVLLADFSRSFAPEAIEQRHVWSGTLINPGTDPGGHGHSSNCYEFFSRGQGGCIIEYMEVRASAATAFVSVLIEDTPWGGTSPFGGGFSAVGGFDIGGTPADSTLEQLRDNPIPIGAGGISVSQPNFWLPTERAYIPAGGYLRFMTAVAPPAAIDTDVFLIIREIPEILGGA